MLDLNVEVDGKRPKGRTKQRWLDALDGDLKPRDSILIRSLYERNGAIDQDEPTPLLSGRKAEEEKVKIA